MKDDLPERAQMLFDRYKEFPEVSRQGDCVLVRREAWTAFLDWRKLQEDEMLPALHELRTLQRGER